MRIISLPTLIFLLKKYNIPNIFKIKTDANWLCSTEKIALQQML